ncbi:8068_t:CDS:2 [Rhizophagus irregularis]|nr:8068_t:CDS:2 [Rhizophagus irregularis]
MSDETVLKSYEGTNMMSITGNLGYPHRRSKTTRWFSLPNSMDSTIDEVPSKDNFSEYTHEEVKEPDHYNSIPPSEDVCKHFEKVTEVDGRGRKTPR